MDRIALQRFANESTEPPAWWRAQVRRRRVARLQSITITCLKTMAFFAACLLAWSFYLAGF